jgi:E3 ubiquitin-protein ligase RNF146
LNYFFSPNISFSKFQGIAFKSRKCALCRAAIPLDFLDNPKLLETSEELEKSEEAKDTYKWFYEGNQGWWAFESRTNSEIEEAWSNNKKSCVVLIAGYCYIIDFENMVQLRQNEPTRHRKIKRDLATAPKKGIAGIRFSNPQTSSEVKTDTQHIDDSSGDLSINLVSDSDSSIELLDSSNQELGQLIQQLSETLSIEEIEEVEERDV